MGFSDADPSDDFLSDAGPDFDPELAPPAPDIEELEGEPDLEPDGWTEQQIRDLLVTQGNATNWLFRVATEDDSWKQTEDDLRAIAPPLTRILNRYDASRAAAAAGDEIILGTALFNYGARNYTKRRRMLERLAAAQPQPVTGRPAPPGTGPENDPRLESFLDAPPDLTPKGV